MNTLKNLILTLLISFLINGCESPVLVVPKYCTEEPDFSITYAYLTLATDTTIQTDFDVVLVSMDYSVTKNDLQRDPSLLLKMIRLTPGQIVAALQWVQEQNWYNKALGLHYMGISLGTLFMPVSISLAQKNGLFMSSSIFGFGGADIGKIFEHHLTPYLGQESSSRVKRIVEMIIALYDPKIYLSELGGPNLLIFATNDQIFPPSSVEKLIQLTPNPKEVVWINGQHIDVDRPEIISATIQTVVRWLRKQIPL